MSSAIQRFEGLDRVKGGVGARSASRKARSVASLPVIGLGSVPVSGNISGSRDFLGNGSESERILLCERLKEVDSIGRQMTNKAKEMIATSVIGLGRRSMFGIKSG